MADEQKRVRAINIAFEYLANKSMADGDLTLGHKRSILEQSISAYGELATKKQANIEKHKLHNANQKAKSVAGHDNLSKSQRRRRKRKQKP